MNGDSLEKCDPIDSLAVNASPESTGVTNFVSESCEAVDVLGKYYTPSSFLKEQSVLQDLKEYFRRPRVLNSGTIGSAVSRVPVTFTTNYLSTVFPEMASRLRGVFGLRFKIVFTLQVAATPFHQGMLVMNWQYECTDNATSTDGVYRRSTYNATCTNLPHVRLDLAETTMCQLKVPFLNRREYIQNVGYEDATLGLWCLNNFGVPVVAGMDAPSYTVYVHLEEMELIGATPEAVADVTVQGGKPVTNEIDFEGHPFSSTLRAASGVASWIARGVPSLASLAGPSSWLLGRAAGVVRYLGYAKPQVLDPIQRMNNIQSVAEHNVDLPSSTVMVAPFSTNALRPHPQFGATEVDEMALPFVLNQWSQIYRGSLSGVAARGDLLYACKMSPCAMWYRSANANANFLRPVLSTATTNSILPSHVFNVASMFRLWSGGFKFRVTWFKNKFHNARVMLTFSPCFSNMVETGSLIELGSTTINPFGYSMIFDFKDSNVFEFDVPYTAPAPLAQFTESFGSIIMRVVDPLKASAVVADQTDFIVEVKCMPGFEVCDPVTVQYPTHVNGVAIQAGAILDNYKSEYLEVTVGEAFSSLKQLIMIPKVCSLESVAQSTGDIGWTLVPWYYQPQLSTSVPGVSTTLPVNTFSYGGNISKCYLYAKGSTDYHISNLNGTDSNTLELMRTPRNFNAAVPALRGNTVYNTPDSNNVRMFSVGDKPVHVRVPSYQRTPRFLTGWLDAISFLNTATTRGAVFSGGLFSPLTLPYLRRRNVNATTPANLAGQIVTYCAGDDASCAHYMGPPPLFLPGTGVTTGAYDPDSRTN